MTPARLTRFVTRKVSVLSFSPLSVGLLVQTSGSSHGWIGDWSPGIGDPTFVGWITVLGYLVASYLCLRVFRRLRAWESEPGALRMHAAAHLIPFLLALLGRRRRLSALPDDTRIGALWLGLALVLLLLGINKQLDLQTAFTETGRIVSHAEGWYAHRRPIQVGFILCVAMAGAWGFGAVLLLARGRMQSLRGVLAGTVFLITFVAIRASSFHHVDRFLGYRLGDFKMNWILELGGISFICLGAYRNGVRAPRDSSRQAGRGVEPRAKGLRPR